MKRGMLMVIGLGLLVGSGCAKKQNVDVKDPSDLIEQAANQAPKKASTDDVDKLFSVKTLYFAYDSALLTDSARDHLFKISKYLKENPRVRLTIEGHCDQRGTTEYNMVLGDKRARSVRTYLSRLGIASSRLRILSHGDLKPVAIGEGESAWAKNRRAEFIR